MKDASDVRPYVLVVLEPSSPCFKSVFFLMDLQMTKVATSGTWCT